MNAKHDNRVSAYRLQTPERNLPSADFARHPGPWEPDLEGLVSEDLAELLESWFGHDKPITVLDLSGVPSAVLIHMIGGILNIAYEALFWGRSLPEGGRSRPQLIVMEEAHRYLGKDANNPARDMVQRIVKEGRKFGVGAMIVSQRPSEIDETILSQCGTLFALRLSNTADQGKRSKAGGCWSTARDNIASNDKLFFHMNVGWRDNT